MIEQALLLGARAEKRGIVIQLQTEVAVTEKREIFMKFSDLNYYISLLPPTTSFSLTWKSHV